MRRFRRGWGSGWPAGLIGALALITAAERFVARNDLDFTTEAALSWKVCRAEARDKAPGRQVLCLGDSLVKFSIVPSVFESRTGRKAYNLAAFGAPPPLSYFALRRALHAGATPEAMVVDFHPVRASTHPQAFQRLWPELLDVRECADLAWTARDASFFASIALGRLIPSIKARAELRASVVDALQGRSASRKDFIGPLWRNWLRNQGAQVAASNRTFRPDDAGAILGGWQTKSAMTLDPVNAVYIRRLLKLAAERNVAVFWLLTPPHPIAQDWRDRNGADEPTLRMARAALEKYSNLIVVDARHAGYDRRWFWDANHVNRRGAAQLSADVADVVDRSLSRGKVADRWVSIDASPSRSRLADVPLEEVDIIGLHTALGERR